MPRNAMASLPVHGRSQFSSASSPPMGRITKIRARASRAAAHVRADRTPLASMPPNPSSTRDQHDLLDLVDEMVADLVIAAGVLALAGGHRADEHGEKAVPFDQLGRTIGEQQGAEHHQAFARSSISAGHDHGPRRCRRHPCPCHPSSALRSKTYHAPARPTASPRIRRPSAPQNVERKPFERPSARCAVMPDRGNGEIGEGEGQTVIETGLDRQAEAHIVPLAFARRADLHAARQHGVGRRQGSAQQDGAGRCKAEAPPAEQRHRCNRDRHRDHQQRPYLPPVLPADRPVDGDARACERGDDDKFGDIFQRQRVEFVACRVDARKAEGKREGGPADADIDQRQGKIPVGQPPSPARPKRSGRGPNMTNSSMRGSSSMTAPCQTGPAPAIATIFLPARRFMNGRTHDLLPVPATINLETAADREAEDRPDPAVLKLRGTGRARSGAIRRIPSGRSRSAHPTHWHRWRSPSGRTRPCAR